MNNVWQLIYIRVPLHIDIIFCNKNTLLTFISVFSLIEHALCRFPNFHSWECTLFCALPNFSQKKEKNVQPT